MPEHIDLETWPRKDHYHFFKGFDDPLFNICADVDVSATLHFAKQQGWSFFLVSLFLSITAVNKVKEFRYRIRGDAVVEHDLVHPSSTVLNDDKTFSFCYFEYQPVFAEFNRLAEGVLVANKQGIPSLVSDTHRDDVIYYTVLPWIHFKSFTHPKQFGQSASIPKIGFGKYLQQGEMISMPVSIEVNHALVDGVHVGEFFEHFQALLQDPEPALTP